MDGWGLGCYKKSMRISSLFLSFLFLLTLSAPFTAVTSYASNDDAVETEEKDTHDEQADSKDGDDEKVDSVWGALKYTGKKIQYGGVKAGEGIKKGGQTTGRAFKKAGRSIKHFFVGDD